MNSHSADVLATNRIVRFNSKLVVHFFSLAILIAKGSRSGITRPVCAVISVPVSRIRPTLLVHA